MDMRSERKLAVNRWLREMTIAIDRMYTNRTDINCEMTSLKFSRLLLSANLATFDMHVSENDQVNYNMLLLVCHRCARSDLQGG